MEPSMQLSDLFFSFKGRINRRLFWLATIFLLLLSIVLDLPFILLLDDESVSSLLTLVFALPHLAVQVKRWHDLARSGWWLLLGLIPIVGLLLTVVLLGFVGGGFWPNKYGPSPLQVDEGYDVIERKRARFLGIGIGAAVLVILTEIALFSVFFLSSLWPPSRSQAEIPTCSNTSTECLRCSR